MTISPEITQALGAILVSAVVYGVHYLTQWLKAKTKNEKVQGAIDVAESLATTVVTQLEQTMVAELKLAAADGKLTDAEKATLKAKAIESLRKIYGEQGLAALQKALGFGEEQLLAFLSGKLEEAVYTLPCSTPPATLPEALALAAALGAGKPKDPREG